MGGTKTNDQIEELEASILAASKQFLTLLQNQGKLAFRRIHVMPIIRAWRYRPCCRTNVPNLSMNEDMAGMPDLLVFVKNGPVLNIEVKSTQGKQSKEQIEYEAAMAKIGHEYHLIRGVDELIEILRFYGVSC